MDTGKHDRKRSQWPIAALGTALGAVVAGAGIFSTAVAVHETPYPFELDGNATNATGVFGPPATGDGKDDWQNVFELPAGVGVPVVGNAETFIRDLPSAATANKETQYDSGKDTLDISAWTRKEVAKVVPDKDNITDAFAKQYMVDIDGAGSAPLHRVIYFGADRFANNGDAALGFWFFQQKVELSGGNGFSPNHTARNTSTGQRGDILVQVDFVSGGSSSQIQIFEWVGSGGSHGPLDLLRPTAIANGDTVCTPDDAACATTNDTDSSPFHWAYMPKFPKQAGKYPHESFYEGGIDLTVLTGDICFNSFLANTRTSHSETADLKDLALGDFNTCGSIALVDKQCEADAELMSPSYNAVTELYQTKHVITIENDGQGGDIYDVAVRDDAVGGDNVCNIVAISGGVGNPSVGTGIPLPDPDPNNPDASFVQVADSLKQGPLNQMTVTLLCQSPSNPFFNSATVRAAQNNGGAPTLHDSYAQGSDDVLPQCLKNVASSLELTKSCPTPVVLDASNGYKPYVCVDISIENTGESRIDVASFKDFRDDGTQADLISELPTGADNKPELQPGEKVDGIKDCYYPAAPNVGQTDPDRVRYGDTVKASGFAHAAPTVEVKATDVATICDLCPIGLDDSD